MVIQELGEQDIDEVRVVSETLSIAEENVGEVKKIVVRDVEIELARFVNRRIQSGEDVVLDDRAHGIVEYVHDGFFRVPTEKRVVK